MKTYPTSTLEVLSVPDEQVSDLVRSMTADRSFSTLVHSINEDLMGRDRQKRELARDALSHLGFVE